MALFRYSRITCSLKLSPAVPFCMSISETKVLPGPSWSLIFSIPLVTASSRMFQALRVSRGKSFLRNLSVISGDSIMDDASASADTQPPSLRTYQVVVAATRDMGIGKDGKLPWRLPSDLKFFKEITMTTTDPGKKNAVVMGRKTWESIPSRFRPLPGRLNVILTRSGFSSSFADENVVACQSILSALEMLAQFPYCVSIERVFVIGGGQILREALNAPQCEAIHLTEIESNIECDTFIPPVDIMQFRPWYASSPMVENNIRYCFVTYVRITNSAPQPFDSDLGVNSNGTPSSKKFTISDFSFLPNFVFEKHHEFMYLGLLRDIIVNGNHKDDRTGTDILSKFGCQSVFWEGIVEELLWFISGSTNANVLQEKDIHIWDGNASREYLDSIGLVDRQEGDVGPIYGFQWRHFGPRYTNMHADYSGQGFDQLLDVIDKIKSDPNDRQIVFCSWNPSDLKLMDLPPCHMFAQAQCMQFYAANGELSCQMYQPSADMVLGVPFDIVSYALLTCMIAHVCGRLPGDFILVIGDAHVYKTHIIPLQHQLQRDPKPFPILKINPQKRILILLLLLTSSLQVMIPIRR